MQYLIEFTLYLNILQNGKCVLMGSVFKTSSTSGISVIRYEI